MTGNVDTRSEALEEYYFLQGEIGRFDQIAHGVKRWSTTVCFALIGAGFYRDEYWLFLASAFAALMFWVTDAQWKKYQGFHIDRAEKLEALLSSSKSPEYSGPLIGHSFRILLDSPNTKSWRYILDLMFYRNVMLPHFPVIVFSGLSLFGSIFLGR